MRIAQLRDYLTALMEAGVDPTTVVCVHDESPVTAACEVSDAILVRGEFHEDPAPKLCAYRPHKGSYLLLRSNADYEGLLNGQFGHVDILELPVDAPAKTWPHGHWFDEPRRHVDKT